MKISVIQPFTIIFVLNLSQYSCQKAGRKIQKRVSLTIQDTVEVLEPPPLLSTPIVPVTEPITVRSKKKPKHHKRHIKSPKAEDIVEKAQKIANGSLGFWHAFIASISVILVSELGDKTWFIAVVMAMRHRRLPVFAGAITALGIMTFLSAFLGWATQVIPRKVTFYISTALFALFGFKMLYEAYSMSPAEAAGEFEEAEEEVKKKEATEQGFDITDVEYNIRPVRKSRFRTFLSTVYFEALTLTFLAEWGDRSQITTIILAARENIVGVMIGGILGHAACTGVAVLGGKMVAQRISVKTVTYIGGVVFLIFALSAFIINQEEF